jgi:protein-disulfide isomerase
MGFGILAGASTWGQSRGPSEIAKTYGSKNAPITMEVFSDFECPSCGALYEQTIKELVKDYVASGKVYLIYRDFPLPMHKYSWKAARYGDAAATIGKFPQVEAALFDNQSAWSTDGSMAKYLEQAVGAADMKAMNKLVDACKDDSGVAQPKQDEPEHHGCPLDEAIWHDVALGNKVPVQATPTFVVTYKGKPSTTSGVVSYAVLKQYFDYLLSH